MAKIHKLKPSRKQAEEAVKTLLAWAGDDPDRQGLKDTPARVARAYQEWFKGYADCDDGNLADDVSEYVTSSLAKDWKDFPKLEQEIKKEPRFQELVLHHIDATTSIDDLEAVKKNADQRCPAGSKPLCSAIAAAAQSALDEHKQAQ